MNSSIFVSIQQIHSVTVGVKQTYGLQPLFLVLPWWKEHFWKHLKNKGLEKADSWYFLLRDHSLTLIKRFLIL